MREILRLRLHESLILVYGVQHFPHRGTSPGRAVFCKVYTVAPAVNNIFSAMIISCNQELLEQY